MLHKKQAPVLLMDKERSYMAVQERAFLEFIRALEWTPALAHHPACRHYSHHLIWIGKLPLCLGCTMMACGAISGLFLLPHLSILINSPFHYLLAVGVLLYLPAICQIWIQRKTYKLIARFLLGISVVFLMYAGLWLTSWSLIGWTLRSGFLIIFIIVWKLTLKLRAQRSSSPCHHCPDGRFPICSYTRSRIPKLADKYFAQSTGNHPEADEFVRALQAISPTRNS